jgi:phosphoribosyl 1,2-cyclic phosphodiesterase
MSLFIASLNSGSNGNCYYVGNNETAVLVDAGLSCRETEKRMAGLQLSLQKVNAIFISHEHTDHIKGLEVLSQKYNIPVYINERTLQNSRLRLNTSLISALSATDNIKIGDLNITSFSKRHDAADPCSFLIEDHEVKVGVFTDIGVVCDQLIHYFRQCDAAFLESNYDEDMLQNGRYPFHLKRRISGGRGHLSNRQAFELFQQHRSRDLSHLLLSHLSRENNCPKLAAALFNSDAGNVQVIVASRDEASAVYHIKASAAPTPAYATQKPTKPQQLALF